MMDGVKVKSSEFSYSLYVIINIPGRRQVTKAPRRVAWVARLQLVRSRMWAHQAPTSTVARTRTPLHWSNWQLYGKKGGLSPFTYKHKYRQQLRFAIVIFLYYLRPSCHPLCKGIYFIYIMSLKWHIIIFINLCILYLLDYLFH